VTDEVKFTDAQWDELARAAEAFAEVLEAERKRLDNVLTVNWAGACSEGVGVLDNLRLLLQGAGGNSFGGAINSEVVYLLGLAQKCREATNVLSGEDSISASTF
jgi:hypothetical protein